MVTEEVTPTFLSENGIVLHQSVDGLDGQFIGADMDAGSVEMELIRANIRVGADGVDKDSVMVTGANKDTNEVEGSGIEIGSDEEEKLLEKEKVTKEESHK